MRLSAMRAAEEDRLLAVGLCLIEPALM